jgi:hypothetical protein
MKKRSSAASGLISIFALEYVAGSVVQGVIGFLFNLSNRTGSSSYEDEP